jgi:hypothetical protein
MSAAEDGAEEPIMGAAVTSPGKVLPMKKIALAALLALAVSPALAQYDDNRRDGVFGPNSNQLPQPDSPKGRSDAQQAPGAPGGYGQPYYPKEPTSGDPRSYRHTNPNTCTGMFCD